MMISPNIRASLKRDDFHRLISAVGEINRHEAYRFTQSLNAGNIDTLLDAEITLDVVRGFGGAPAALPMSLLWYVPIRAALRDAGLRSRRLADLTATVPIAFHTTRASKLLGGRDAGLTSWNRFIDSMPRDTVARSEAAANCAAHALWLSGIFPHWITRRGQGDGMIRAYVDFAAGAFRIAARGLDEVAPGSATVFRRASKATGAMHRALRETAGDYIGEKTHTTGQRLDRFLARLGEVGGNDMLQ